MLSTAYEKTEFWIVNIKPISQQYTISFLITGIDKQLLFNAVIKKKEKKN